jgi:TolB-like protein/Flp pilus assembly protein TadD
VRDTSTQPPETGVWDRLRRRKVVQWSVAYVAAAWALLQGLEFLAGIYDWPTAFLRVVTLVLAVGLPIVLTLAWYHGDRGEQRIGGTELSIVAVLFLLGGGVVWYYQRTAESTATGTSAPAAEKPIPTDASIAVLPFVNMSADKEQEYFADGISEELLNLLAQVPELRVIARTSSFSFKGKDVDIAEIARRLNVANVLEGSVRRSGDTLRITAQLVRASDSSHLWSQTYDRQMTDVFKVQDEIAAAVVDELKIKLLDAAPRTKVTDPKAYSVFLQARETSLYDASSIERAIALYKQALAIDETYAPAWDGLANSYYYQMDLAATTTAQTLPLARDAVNRALTNDPSYAPAYARAALIKGATEGDLAGAARHLEQGLALDPSNFDLISAAVKITRRLGRLNQSIALAEYAVTRDPVSVEGQENLANAYALVGRLDEAVAAFRRAITLSPQAGILRESLGEALLRKGDAREALAEIQQEPDEPSRLLGLPMAYHALGQKAKSDAALEELIRKQEHTMPYYIAYVHAYRGETDRAFEWLEKAIAYRDPYISFTAIDPTLIELRKDARWFPLLRRLGQAPDQLAAIKFDVTIPD